jgi:hypothetical protein
MIQAIVAILLGLMGLVGVIFGLLSLISGGLGGGMLLFTGLGNEDTFAIALGGWTLLGLVVTTVAVLFGLIESLLALGGGILAISQSKTGTLAWAGLLCALHLIVLDLIWSVTYQIGTLGITLGLGPEGGDMLTTSLLGIAGSIPVYIWVLVKSGFWLWTWRSARAFAVQT